VIHRLGRLALVLVQCRVWSDNSCQHHQCAYFETKFWGISKTARPWRSQMRAHGVFLYTIQPVAKTGLTTVLTTVLNEQPLFLQPVVNPV